MLPDSFLIKLMKKKSVCCCDKHSRWSAGETRNPHKSSIKNRMYKCATQRKLNSSATAHSTKNKTPQGVFKCLNS